MARDKKAQKSNLKQFILKRNAQSEHRCGKKKGFNATLLEVG
jgi:hypothetical protein